MKTRLSSTLYLMILSGCCLALSACKPADPAGEADTAEHAPATAEYERGPHNGRLLRSDDFALELAIFETGVPPEFRAWAFLNDTPVDPGSVSLKVQLTRLGDVIDRINFTAEGDYLRGDKVVYEPHSFVVTIDAELDGRNHHWEYDNFEGRTRIEPAVAEAFGLETAVAGPAVIHETIEVYGQVEPNADKVGVVMARFDGQIKSVSAAVGDEVKAGQALLVVESNQSLKPFTVTAPLSGTITARNAHAGEPTAGRALFTIVDTSTVWVTLDVFPGDLQRVKAGAPVTVFAPQGGVPVTGSIDRFQTMSEPNQAVKARVVLDNTIPLFFSGSYVQANIQVAEYAVPLAVKRTGLQGFRDFTVVYAQVGDQYEVRMLELGRQDDEWVEVLGGLEPGTTYVTANSYLVKADIEKSGASHDH
jgi:cobalt-zinc-cadmium efflux system membrane fusion protein